MTNKTVTMSRELAEAFDREHSPPPKWAVEQLRALLAVERPQPVASPLYEAWIDGNEDLMGRLLLGKATEGDQLQAHNHIEACDIYEDIYGQLCELIEPYVQRNATNPNGKLPASVVEGFGVVFREWADHHQRQDVIEPPAPVAVVLNEVRSLLATANYSASRDCHNARVVGAACDLIDKVKVLNK